jgi:hypothetical protein
VDSGAFSTLDSGARLCFDIRVLNNLIMTFYTEQAMDFTFMGPGRLSTADDAHLRDSDVSRARFFYWGDWQ